MSFKKNLPLLAALIVAFFYQIYRYPFEYGAAPPLAWRVGKYAALAFICLLMTPRFIKQVRKFGFFEICYVVVFSFLLLFGWWSNQKFLEQSAFFGLFAFWLAQSCENLPYESLSSFLFFAWFVNLLLYIIEAAGLAVYGKPFVWSTDSIFTSRFGGMLVEPLGAPYLSFLFLGLAFEVKGLLRWVVCLSSILTIVMTHTWTAIGFLMIVLGVFVFGLAKRRGGWPLALAFTVSFFAAVSALSIAIYLFRNQVRLLTEKLGSAGDHVSYWWPSRWPLFPMQESAFSETWWVFSMQNMGMVWTVSYGFVMGMLLYACFVRGKWLLAPRPNGTFNGVFVGIYLAGAFVVFGSFNQLYLAMYPVGLLFMLFALMIKYDKISERRTQGTA